ncbi:MAG: hypothetical protein ABW199_05385 [Caulobacterales bacterium]
MHDQAMAANARQSPAFGQPGPPPRGLNWFNDFAFERDGLLVKKTGWRADYSLSNVLSLLRWMHYFATLHFTARAPGPAFTIHFAPDKARPWYMAWALAKIAGARIVTDAGRADVVMQFEDATYSDVSAPTARDDSVYVNFRCRDVSKSHIASAFEDVFGYSLAADPRAYHGTLVEKCELNGAHDGRIVACPRDPAPGFVYQRLIDNRMQGRDLVEDLRTVTVGGRPMCIFLKRRPADTRFANMNTEVAYARVEDKFTEDEIALISKFCARIGLEFGGLDVLRDRTDGRIYIVDANKTDMGPPIGLPLKPKIEAMRMIAIAFRAYVGKT